MGRLGLAVLVTKNLFNWLLSCRTGPLRVGRPLRGVCTGLARINSLGPPVGRDDLSSDQRRTIAIHLAQTS